MPNVTAPLPDLPYHAAIWIGIDGDGSPDVFQAGITCDVQSGTASSSDTYFWWAWYPLPAFEVTNPDLTFRPGDMVTLLLCTPHGAGSTTGTAFVLNRTTGKSTNIGLVAPSGTQLVGNRAEWIVEAPQTPESGQILLLADYGQVTFTNCQARTTNGTLVGGGTGSAINMIDTSGNTVSQSTLSPPTTVQCDYVG